MKKAPRWEEILLLALGTTAFAFGAWQLFASGVGSVVSTIIVGSELAVSVAVYLALRRKWAAGPTRPWNSN